MRSSAVRLGVGAQIYYDGETLEVVELDAAGGTLQVLAKDQTGNHYRRIAAKDLTGSGRGKVLTSDTGIRANDDIEPAGAVLATLNQRELNALSERASHIREVLTGFKAGNEELATRGEPRAKYSQADH
ncbi:hypothetical protein MTP03_47080 [Tsukamurella sp. PLM1]|nr:hypothetical protein MTP03_47080 [Tsukamurella sp. PLM1]